MYEFAAVSPRLLLNAHLGNLLLHTPEYIIGLRSVIGFTGFSPYKDHSMSCFCMHVVASLYSD